MTMKKINIDNTSFIDIIKYAYVVPEINDLFYLYPSLCIVKGDSMTENASYDHYCKNETERCRN